MGTLGIDCFSLSMNHCWAPTMGLNPTMGLTLVERDFPCRINSPWQNLSVLPRSWRQASWGQWPCLSCPELFPWHKSVHYFWINKYFLGVPIVVQQKHIQLVSMRMWVQSLALLRIQTAMSCGVGPLPHLWFKTLPGNFQMRQFRLKKAKNREFPLWYSGYGI